MRSHSYLNSAKKIIDSYDGVLPLSVWLKDHFRTNKKFGSKDRKEISHICYCYYRLGKAFMKLDTVDRMLTGLFLCSWQDNIVLRELKPEWNERISDTLEQKLRLSEGANESILLFPFITEVSESIDRQAFSRAHFLQPYLFLRVRPGAAEEVTTILTKEDIHYQKTGDCITLANGTRVDVILPVDRAVVVQDLNSQRTLYEMPLSDLQGPISAWDCCAASGGKAILLQDLLPQASITVSDVRESILVNLRKRFSRAGIRNYYGFVADLTSPQFSINNHFDLIICDAPCSGSGTWGRTPEQMMFFQKDKITHYSTLQKKISINATSQLARNGVFVYITCSVYAEENERVVEFINENSDLSLMSSRYLKGYDQRADTLFVAVFRRS